MRYSELMIFVPIIFFSSCNAPWCKMSFADRMLNYYTSQMSEDYGAMYQYASNPPKPQDYLLQLTEVTPFQWDTLVWVSDSLKLEDISKLIGTQYEEKDVYKGKQKLIFMNGSEIADIYALRSQDSVTFIPGDVQHGSAKVSRDTWFTVRASDTAFILKRFGVSDIYLSQKLPEKKGPRFEIKDEDYTFCVSSDTVESKREYYQSAGTDFNMHPLTKRMAKSVFTDAQMSQLKKDKFIIFVNFSFYIDTGEIFECYWGVEPRYEHLFSKKQWEQLSEIMFNMRIDPRMKKQPQKWFKCPEGKRIFVGWIINLRISLLD